ncbi:MAG: hypothetical protein ACLU84_06215 [Clostridia bacterium]
MPILNLEKRKAMKAIRKEREERIKQLKTNKQYEQILEEYGLAVYRKHVSKEYKEQDIANIQKQGNLEEIYEKYGEKVYNQLAYQMKKKEIEEIYGKRNPKAMYYKIENTLKYKVLLPIISTLSVSSTLAPLAMVGRLSNSISVGYEIEKQEAEEEYAQEIKISEEKRKQYAENIKKLNLNDIETIEKVLDDMWNTILGYGEPTLEFPGYNGISLEQEEPKGCCRNFADYVVKMLNAINPEYNARMGSVENPLTEYKVKGIVNIQTRIVEREIQDKPLAVTCLRNDIDKKIVKMLVKNIEVTGNHLIVFMDIKEDNITLAIEPMSAIVGIYRNGKIELFNVQDTQKEAMTRMILGDAAYRGGNIYDKLGEELESYIQIPNLSQEELEEKYSVENLNKALESARQKERDYLYAIYQQDFKERIQAETMPKEEKYFELYTYEEMKQTKEELIQKLGEEIDSKEEIIVLANQYRRLLYSKQYYQEKESTFIGKEVLYDSFEIEPAIKEALRENLLLKGATIKDTNAIGQMEIEKRERDLLDFYLDTYPKVPIEELKVGELNGDNIFLLAADGEIQACMLWKKGETLYKTKEDIQNNQYNQLVGSMLKVTDTEKDIPVIGEEEYIR